MTPNSTAEAALGKYSFLDKIDGWRIERKVDPLNSEITCRASLPIYFSWFGSRIRLNKEDVLVIPQEFTSSYTPNYLTIKKVKNALKACRRSLIYEPNTFSED